MTTNSAVLASSPRVADSFRPPTRRWAVDAARSRVLLDARVFGMAAELDLRVELVSP